MSDLLQQIKASADDLIDWKTQEIVKAVPLSDLEKILEGMKGEENERLWENKAVTDYWHEHYVNKGMCSLCGNSGEIDTTGTRTAAGLGVGKRNLCICPNGQHLRAAFAGKEGS